MKVFCDDEKYRKHVAELAASVFHVNLHAPQDDADADEVANFYKMVGNLEEEITRHAIALSQQFRVPIQIVHQDINECVEFLPEGDLKLALEERGKQKLH